MNKEFVPYEEALALKELGFDERCFGHYNLNGVFFWKILCSDEDNELQKTKTFLSQAFCRVHLKDKQNTYSLKCFGQHSF